MNHEEMPAVQPSAPTARLPLAKPVVTNVLLGLLVAIFLVQVILSRSIIDISGNVLMLLGAQVNSAIAGGAYWLLLSAMFLHGGLMHLAFNGWALFSIGRDMEALLGSLRFTAIYLLSGLAGNVAYYVFGDNVLSIGASGAIFGLIGAEAAFFLCNRRLFGKFGRQRLGNLAALIGINLFFGFTVPGINNFAHVGGLLMGFALGLALAPRYRFAWVQLEATPVGQLIDLTSKRTRWLAIGLALVVLLAGVWAGNQRWAGSALMLRQQAQAALQANDLAQAQALLTRAVAVDPSDPNTHYALGVVQAQRGNLDGAAQALETALQLVPGQVDTELLLGLVYAEQGRGAEARPLLAHFLTQEPTGERADYARQTLDQLPK